LDVSHVFSTHQSDVHVLLAKGKDHEVSSPWNDELLPNVTKGSRLRACGPMLKRSDSEVLIMEVVGTDLGLS
jgi:hypothetical protein